MANDQKAARGLAWDILDLRRRSHAVKSGGAFDSFLIRVLDLSGLPSGIPGVTVASHLIERAARLVGLFNPAYIARLILLGGGRSEKAVDAVVSQTHLARMSDQEASALFDAAQWVRDRSLGCWTFGDDAADFERPRPRRSSKPCCVASRVTARPRLRKRSCG